MRNATMGGGGHAGKIATVLVMGFAVLAASAAAQVKAQPSGNIQATLQIGTGDFALCAATPCTPTGKTITTNQGITYQEASCICPILSGPAVAMPSGGNMKGSCAPPANPGGVWSLFAPRDYIPQAITNWSRLPSKSAAQIQICLASLNLGAQTVNCFFFACTTIKPIHGVKVADCRCPIAQANNGTMPPATTFGTMAGQGNQAYCRKYPVSASLP
jgi:hypothetical protein